MKVQFEAAHHPPTKICSKKYLQKQSTIILLVTMMEPLTKVTMIRWTRSHQTTTL